MAARQNRKIEARRRTAAADGMYVYGNTVRKTQVYPERRREQEEERRERRSNPKVQRSRKQALRMNPAYLFFLTTVTVVTLLACVWYIQLRTEVSSRAANLTEMQQELVELKEENTTRYNAIVDSVNLEEVRERAMDDLGMVNAEKGQIQTYQNPENDYIEQYETIPEDGVLIETK